MDLDGRKKQFQVFEKKSKFSNLGRGGPPASQFWNKGLSDMGKPKQC